MLFLLAFLLYSRWADLDSGVWGGGYLTDINDCNNWRVRGINGLGHGGEAPLLYFLRLLFNGSERLIADTINGLSTFRHHASPASTTPFNQAYRKKGNRSLDNPNHTGAGLTRV
ncbi:hypothetical protein B0J18DRAFT_270758 [Chaetomium sp. MPI-SDFR-AT-0129]|nr:hypothetical protein B0J18DRAFT_270758 [Chaetomium sp. MPI-SDFR-AT-0129]